MSGKTKLDLKKRQKAHKLTVRWSQVKLQQWFA